jgi:hypothetical protein
LYDISVGEDQVGAGFDRPVVGIGALHMPSRQDDRERFDDLGSAPGGVLAFEDLDRLDQRQLDGRLHPEPGHAGLVPGQDPPAEHASQPPLGWVAGGDASARQRARSCSVVSPASPFAARDR